jgi:hypothetical protein
MLRAGKFDLDCPTKFTNYVELRPNNPRNITADGIWKCKARNKLMSAKAKPLSSGFCNFHTGIRQWPGIVTM